ncbi:hypothetical protein [Sphingobium chungbukense]|uniref:Lipoprotein n=1 Tax=Sphingobium chungbukense TaxID=56193 RepID=A0A0M3AZ42_9SPHN|nr:hypothetical protein [Sphingobium chungbukense]KKW93819.1 hypothetical protein YP76_03920 [Sphingobium chungbukense]
MRVRYGAALCLALLSACDGREESAIDNLANGANAAQVENNVRAEAQAVMEPLTPPAPGTAGGLPVGPQPVVEEDSVDPKGPQGAAQVVQGYYGLLEEKRYDDAQDLWNANSAIGAEDDARFAARFRNFSEVHANVGAPGDVEGAAGSLFVTVPVQVYGRLAANGKPWYRLRQVTLRRVNDVPGASEADRRWHIESIGSYEPPASQATETGNAISATDGLLKKQ